MVPIEYVLFLVIFIFVLIGLVRGFLRELGVTTVMIVVLYGIQQLVFRLPPAIQWVMQLFRLPVQEGAGTHLLLGVAVVFVIVAAYISYQGETLAFDGTPPRGLLGFLLNALTGAINGYLVAGSIWFYANQYNNILFGWGVLQGELTALGQRLLAVMPPTVLGPYFPFLIVFMIILRVIR